MNKKEKVKKERVQSRYCKERSNRERERERERERDTERERDKNRVTRNYGKKDRVRVRKCTTHAKELRRNKK